MSQRHMDRLTSIDASFLTNETDASHMHVGAVLIFEGPPPGYDDLLEHIRGRLHLVPRFRQKLAFPPMESGRPFWIDDPSFNLEYHVRHSALPAPGSEEQLERTAARVFSQQLDRTKPLWELWLVQGLKRKRFALISKTHHALVDGVSGVDIATVLFDVKPVPEPAEAEHEWIPNPEPSAASLLARNVEDLASTPLRLARRIESAVLHPRPAVREVSEAAEAVGEVAWALANPAPEVPLNTEIGVVAGALRRWLHGRGVRTEGVELRALVPMSIRAEDEHGQLGNRIAAMRGPLPVYIADPVRRLEAVREAMQGVKSSKQALGAEVISRFNDFAPPTLLAQASRLNFSTRLFNLIVTNVPGPQIPLYILGRELEDVFPVAFLPENHALAIAIMSYNGKIDFGLLADYDAMEDVEEIAAGIAESIEELEREAERATASAEPAAAT
jgi:diacylglycerol O-acyltransferase